MVRARGTELEACPNCGSQEWDASRIVGAYEAGYNHTLEIMYCLKCHYWEPRPYD